MPPKAKVSREDVVRSAVELVDEKGLAHLSARNLATQLHTSVAPVYQQFESMEQLMAALIRRVIEMIQEYMAYKHTNDEFLNMGVGTAKFARDHRNLYHMLYMERDEFITVREEIMKDAGQRFPMAEQYAGVPEEALKKMLERMSIFTHGLASLISVGLLQDESDENIIAILKETGQAVIASVVSEVS